MIPGDNQFFLSSIFTSYHRRCIIFTAEDRLVLQLFFSVFFTQSVYASTFPPTTPTSVTVECAAGNISLLNAVDCLFYRYNQQQWIKYIWAIGLLAAGQSSTMTVS